LQQKIPNDDLIIGLQNMAALELLAVDKRAVGATHIDKLPIRSLANDHSMLFRDIVLRKVQIIGRNASDADLVLVQSHLLPPPILLLNDYPQHPLSLPPQRFYRPQSQTQPCVL
jgi:hypothetical protein